MSETQSMDVLTGESQRLGRCGEEAVAEILRLHGRDCQVETGHGAYAKPWDILVDHRIRVEVKTSLPNIRVEQRGPSWFFNIHRHGFRDESEVDLYVLRMEGQPFKKPVHALFSSPIGRSTVEIPLTKIQTTFSKYVVAFDKFAQTGKFERGGNGAVKSIPKKHRYFHATQFDKNTINKLKALAIREDRSVGQLVRFAVERYLKFVEDEHEK